MMTKLSHVDLIRSFDWILGSDVFRACITASAINPDVDCPISISLIFSIHANVGFVVQSVCFQWFFRAEVPWLCRLLHPAQRQWNTVSSDKTVALPPFRLMLFGFMKCVR